MEDKEIENLLEKGLDNFNKGLYFQAIKIYDEILINRKKISDEYLLEAYIYRGKSRFKLSKFNGAIDDFEIVKEIDPNLFPLSEYLDSKIEVKEIINMEKKLKKEKSIKKYCIILSFSFSTFLTSYAIWGSFKHDMYTECQFMALRSRRPTDNRCEALLEINLFDMYSGGLDKKWNNYRWFLDWIKIAQEEKTRGYTSVSAIQTAFAILQSGIIDRENKSELEKLWEFMERIEEETSGIIDI